MAKHIAIKNFIDQFHLFSFPNLASAYFVFNFENFLLLAHDKDVFASFLAPMFFSHLKGLNGY